MVCRKSGQKHDHEKWIFKGKLLEIVNDFNYLGTVFNYNGYFTLNQKQLGKQRIKSVKCVVK